MKGKNLKREERQRKLAAALMIGAMGAVTAEPAIAQELQRVSADERVEFDIAAQPLSRALSEFARQARVNALYFSDDLRGLSSPPLRGSFTRQQALDLLLQRSGYDGRISGGNLVLVQEQTSRPQQESAAASGADPAQSSSEDSDDGEEEIVVTGTRIRGAAPAGANVITIDREEIEALGRSSVQDVIQTLPQNFAGSQNEATQEGTLNARSNLTFGSSVDLRGLGADATLTLVNGRRLAPAGNGNFVDISTIPLSAVQRVEVLADGASATYGADAVGGVVNIILNRSFTGAETSFRYGGTTQGGGEDLGFAQLAGFAWESGQLTAGYDYRRRGDIDILDRDFTRTADFRDRGGSNFERTNSNPGNITRIGATTVNLAIPRGQDGTSLSEGDLISGAPNFTNINEDAWLAPRQENHSIFLSGTQEFGGGFEVFADVLASQREAYSERENLGANLVVPQTNAYRVLNNLFPGQGNLTIAYHMGADLGPVTLTTQSRAFSAITGVAYTFENDWRAEGSVSLARSEETIDTENFFDSSAIGPALASSNLATAFNPFADGSNTDPAVLAGLTFAQHTETHGRTTTFAFKADGPLFRFWGGLARAALGVERREEAFRFSRVEIRNTGISPSPTQAPGSRTVDAIFGELSLPLLSEGNGVPFVRNLDLSLSARREEASDYGGETTPKAGITWEIVEGLALRGSWGRSFKGPLFNQLLGGTGVSYLTATAAQDPLADNGSTGVLVITGANPNLSAERATTWTAGIEVAPRWALGFRANATYFDVVFEDRVSTPASPFAILANPTGYETIVFRDPDAALIASYLALSTPTGTPPADGVEVIIDRRGVNLSSQHVRGLDLASSYTAETAIGDLTFSAAASLLFDHELTIAPGAAPVVALNTLNGPIDLRGRASLAWQRGIWNASLSVNYVDDYTDNVSIPARAIDSFTTYDLRWAIDWRGQNEGGRGAQFALSIQNLTDENPPFVNNATGYAFDASNASAFGRMVTFEVRQRW